MQRKEREKGTNTRELTSLQAGPVLIACSPLKAKPRVFAPRKGITSPVLFSQPVMQGSGNMM